MKNLLLTAVLLIGAVTASNALTQEQIDATVAKITTGVSMTNGIAVASYTDPSGAAVVDPTPEPDGGGVTPDPTPEPTPVGLRGAPAPWGDDAVLAARVPPAFTRSELDWIADNFDLLTYDQFISFKESIPGALLADRQAVAPMIFVKMSEILADPLITPYGYYGPYATAYSRLCTGSLNVSTMAVFNPGSSSLYSTFATNARSETTATQWNDALSFPLNATQIAKLKTTFSVATGWNASVDATTRTTLLARINALTPAF